jgi:hypothetical protein
VTEKRRVGKHPSLGAPYGGPVRQPASPSDPFERSPRTTPKPTAAPPPTHPLTLVLSIQRADGLGTTRIIDGLEMEHARYPEDIVRMTFGKMLENFIRDARDLEESK